MRSAPCSAVRRLAALGLLFLVVLVENGRGARGGGEFLNPRPPWAESYVREMTAQFGELFANESNRPLIHARLTLREGVCWTPHRQTGKWLGDVLPNYTVPMRLLRAKHFCEHLGSLCAGVVCNAGSLTECTVRQRRAPTDSGRAMLATGPATDVTFVKACSDSELSFNASSNGYPCAIGHFFALSAASCEPCTGIGTQGNAAFVSHGGIDCSNVLPNAVPFDHSMCDGGPLSCVTGIIGPVANEVIVALPNDSAAAKGALQADFRATAGKVKLNSKLVTPVVALIIGAMKGGTMTLWEALSRHPHVFRTVKEHHYFDTGYDTRTLSEYLCKLQGSCSVPAAGELQRGLARAVSAPSRPGVDLRPEELSMLSPVDPRGVRLDASPSYLYNPLVPGRVWKALGPRARPIVLLREPTERCLSHWFFINGYHCRANHGLHHVYREMVELQSCLDLSSPPGRNTSETEAFALWIDSYAKCIDFSSGLSDQLGFARVVYKSLYALQLGWWRRFYPNPDDMLILKSEAMYSDLPGTLRRVTQFLGIPSFEELGLVAPENVHGHAKDPSAAASCDLTPMRQILDTFFRDPTTAPDSADTNREEDVGEDDWDDVEWEVNVEDGHLVEFDNAAQPASKTIRYRPFVSHNISVGWTAPDTKKRQ